MMIKIFSCVKVALLTCSTMALAQSASNHAGHHQHSMSSSTMTTTQSASGVVKRVDVGAGKITVDHGPIKSLRMDAMIMVFRVKDPAMLKQVKAGDRINFDAGRINGALTILKMKKR